MPRPRICKRIGFRPEITYFKPAGIRIINLEESILTLSELEAVRLKDLEGLEEKSAAKRMGISQPTLNRILRNARKKIADAIVNGKAIRVEGGNIKFAIPRRNRRRWGQI